MPSTYQAPTFVSQPLSQLQSDPPARVPVVVVGAGPAGLATAIDLAQHGVQTVLLSAQDTLPVGSRGICHAKRTLEILDRLGVGEECVQKGVSWNVGRTFFRDEEVFRFNLLSQPDHHRPEMINLQQYHLEELLIRRAQGQPGLKVRFCNSLVALDRQADHLELRVQTPEGSYALQADWLVAADGTHSGIREMLKLDTRGKTIMERFLIVDIVLKADFPAERWFWFDPPFHPGQSALLHRQADNVWRVDFKLGWDADIEEEKKSERIIPKIKAMLGEDQEFELVWVSVYTSECQRLSKFRHERVLFVGDAAHQVSPLGARSTNAGIQDADNLAWKLHLVTEGKAPESLLDTYTQERVVAADENLLNSSRSSDFITPKTRISMDFRNAVLGLAQHYPFARALVNSGRLSVPAFLTNSSLNTPDAALFAGDMMPGAPCDDCPMRAQVSHFWLLERLGNDFRLLVYIEQPDQVQDADALQGLMSGPMPLDVILVTPSGGRSPHGFKVFEDYTGRFAERYDAAPNSAWLIRPDQHVAARWRSIDASQVRLALDRALGRTQEQ